MRRIVPFSLGEGGTVVFLRETLSALIGAENSHSNEGVKFCMALWGYGSHMGMGVQGQKPLFKESGAKPPRSWQYFEIWGTLLDTKLLDTVFAWNFSNLLCMKHDKNIGLSPTTYIAGLVSVVVLDDTTVFQQYLKNYWLYQKKVND